MVDHPPRDCLEVVEAGRERVLGRQAVLDRHDRRSRTGGEFSGDRIHQPRAAGRESATVGVHDHTGRRALVLVDPDRDAGDDVLGDLGDLDGDRKHRRRGTRRGEVLRRVAVAREIHHRPVLLEPVDHPGVDVGIAGCLHVRSPYRFGVVQTAGAMTSLKNADPESGMWGCLNTFTAYDTSTIE